MRAISALSLGKKNFATYPFEGVWYDTFGCPQTNAKWFIYGKSGQGKTTFLVRLAAYLSQFSRVAYVSSEEGPDSVSIEQAFRHNDVTKAQRARIKIFDGGPFEDLKAEMQARKRFHVWIIDSINFLGYGKEQVDDLLRQQPKKMIAMVGWGDGNNPIGSIGVSCRFMAGIKVNVDRFVATANSRYGGNGQPFVINEQMAARCNPMFNRYTTR